MVHTPMTPAEVNENGVSFWRSYCNCGHIEERQTEELCIETMMQHASLEQARIEADPETVRFCPSCGAVNLEALRVAPEDDEDAEDAYHNKFFSANCKKCFWTGSIIPDASQVHSNIYEGHQN